MFIKQFQCQVGTARKVVGHLCVTAAEEQKKKSLACGTQNIGLNFRNISLLAALIAEMAKLILAQCVH